jgi:phosphohistidine phosphatase
MFLYLVRHAEALSKEEDASRSLSDAGIKNIKKVAAFAADMDLEVSEIFHSGKMRALQTAQVLADHVKCEKDISQTDGLSPMDDPGIWFERLSKMNDNVMITGHLPYLAKLSSLILCGKGEKNVIDFAMGCIVCLKRSDDVNWTVDWIIKPGMIKQL